MCIVTKGFVGRVATTTEQYRALYFYGLPIGAFQSKRACYFERTTGNHFKEGLTILHFLCFAR